MVNRENKAGETETDNTEANGAAITNKMTILLLQLNLEEGVRAERRD